MITTILVVRTSSNPKPTVRRQLEVMNLKDLKKEEIKEMCNNMDHSDFWMQESVDDAVELYVHKVQV